MFKGGYFLQLSGCILGCSESLSCRKCSKVQYVKQVATGSGDTEQKVFEVKRCATGRGILCNLVVLGKCSKAGVFPALWWLSGTVYSGECLKVPEKCRM